MCSREVTVDGGWICGWLPCFIQVTCNIFEEKVVISFCRGEITRDRGSKQKLLRDASSTVTGLAFKSTAATVLLFVATESSVFVCNITHKDGEQRVSFSLSSMQVLQFSF